MPLTIFLNGLKGRESGIYYVDSTSIEVCNFKKEKRHKVFHGLSSKGKNSMGWFFGFKLHLIINNHGRIPACNLTKANVDDRNPVLNLVSGLRGWLFGNKPELWIRRKKRRERKELKSWFNRCKGTKHDTRFFAILYAIKKIAILASTKITIKLGCNFGRQNTT